jgi:uncharacterized radical SAM protein YgiQ
MQSKQYKITDWLPTTKEEVLKRGWDELDVIIISGDAYVDHPSFGHAVIARIIEKEGFKVAIIPQPNWKDDLRDFKKLGKPKLFFGVTSGCLDSMVSNYTALKRKRSDDSYTPGGQSGFRPDNATVVYSKIVKNLYPDTPVIIGGLEASLRRLTYYDYWSESLKPSILIDSGADLLVYGMGEAPIKEILKTLTFGTPFSKIKNIPQTAYLQNNNVAVPEIKKVNTIKIHSHEACLASKEKYGENFRMIEEEAIKLNSNRIIQEFEDKNIIVNPPYPPLTEEEADSFHELPYTRLPHPKYNRRGEIPAYEMIKFSVNIHRGCFGGCSFCSISTHQGKFVSSRSEASVINEIKDIVQLPDFKGHISDLGGPSANMYKMKGINQSKCEECKRFSCIYPNICSNLNWDHKPMTELYKRVSKIEGIKKITIGSGLRYDMFIGKSPEDDKKYGLSDYFKALVTKHVSGRLKIAPEHTNESVLKIMRKPSFDIYREFKKRFYNISVASGLKQEIIPYFISSHPGCKLENMAELAADTKSAGLKLEQVQDFTPLPMTLSAVIYYTGVDPYTKKQIYSAKDVKEKDEQRRFFFWYKPENKSWIMSTLNKIKRTDLIRKLY